MQESKIPNYIAIEGPIGVGKTSLSRKIAMDFGHELCLEESDENPFLKSFYKDKQKYAFASQLYFVMQRSQQIDMYFSTPFFSSKNICLWYAASQFHCSISNLSSSE